ncbi:MAG: hypothetical protein K2H75_00740 [Muribaculaceae bacterium]|nr:hypothetical protein [Muribaculaceae bacterium]
MGCGRVRYDGRLGEIESLSEQYSDSAVSAAVSRLELINRLSLSEADRRYYDFLRVKTADKAYITHTSDSLILSVIDYAASHRRELSYPEALYYGGRVYSDIGDYPTALRYFQQALDELPESSDRKNLELKVNILSQTATLLDKLRLYRRAISYIEESLIIDSLLNDSVGIMYDLGQLGGVYRRSQSYDTAELNIRRAYDIAEMLSHENRYTYMAQLGAIKYYKGRPDSALLYLRHAIKHVHTVDTNYVKAFAAKAYLRLDILDTAYAYAKTLIWGKHSHNRAIGYEVIMNASLIKFIPEDSLPIYLASHRDLIEEELENNESREALIQNSMYNYHVHERQRIKSETVKNRLQKIMLLVIILGLGLVCIIFYQKNRNKKNLLQLREALDKLSALRWSLHYESEKAVDNNSTKNIELTELSPTISGTEPSLTEIKVMEMSESLSETGQLKQLKEQLRSELMALADESSEVYSVPEVILLSAVYSGFQDYLNRDRPVPETSALWEELEERVCTVSEHFRYRMSLLTGGKLKAGDYHTVLLLKCGFTPTQISKLLGRAKSSIGSKRESLSMKLFGEKLNVKTVDKLIRLL